MKTVLAIIIGIGVFAWAQGSGKLRDLSSRGLSRYEKTCAQVDKNVYDCTR